MWHVFSDYRKSMESSAGVPNGKWKQKLHAPVILFEFIHLVLGNFFWYPKTPIDASGHLLTTPPSCIICPKCHSMEITHQMAKLVSLAIKENNLMGQSLKNLTPEQQKSCITYIQIFVRLENLTKVITAVWHSLTIFHVTLKYCCWTERQNTWCFQEICHMCQKQIGQAHCTL